MIKIKKQMHTQTHVSICISNNLQDNAFFHQPGSELHTWKEEKQDSKILTCLVFPHSPQCETANIKILFRRYLQSGNNISVKICSVFSHFRLLSNFCTVSGLVLCFLQGK